MSDARWYVIGFTEHDAQYEADVIAWLRGNKVPCEPYTAGKRLGPAWRGATSAQAPTAPAAQPGQPSAPFDGARVTAYATERGNTGFRCWDKALRMSWLFNDHVDMPGVWKHRVGNVWYRIDDRTMGRAAMVARSGQAQPSPVAPLPFTPQPPARKARKR